MKCPKCEKVFPETKNLKYRVSMSNNFFKILKDELLLPWKTGLESVHRPTVVVCPSCGYEYSLKEYKFLGLMEHTTFKRILFVLAAIICLSFLLFPILLIVKGT